MQTITDLIEEFIADVCSGKTNETPRAYRGKLRHLELFLRGNQITSQADIDQFRKYLLNRNSKQRGGKTVSGQLSRFTIRSVLATTKFFLRWGCEHRYWPTI